MADFDPELAKLMQEVATEMKDYFKQNEDKFSQNQKRFETIQQKLYSYVERKCAKEVEWLKKNENQNTKDFESKLKDFEECARQNDFGFSNFVRDLQSEQSQYFQQEEKCVLDCKKNLTSTNEIKDCLKKCLISSTEKYNSLYDRVDQRMNDINSKL